MKHILLVSMLAGLAAVSAQAQGTIKFSNDSTTKSSTNSVVGGATTGLTGAVNPPYRFALFRSTSATSVNGQTTAIAGGTNVNYAFNDGNWTFVTYGTNSFSGGQFVGIAANSSGANTVGSVASGATAQFVMIGWSANVGLTVSALQSWFNGGNPNFPGWIGQSAVSGAITLGGSTTPATLFGSSAPAIPGFILGRADPLSGVFPVITTQPLNKTVPVGATVNFSASAYGTPSPAYQWMFNTNTVLPGATSSTLTLNNVQLTNAGTYSVLITNSSGSTNSFAATLTVNAPSGNGYVIFGNSSVSVTKIFTNTSVGGAATGLTAGPYNYALYVSTTATSVSGQTAAIVGGASSNYAFNAGAWTLAATGTNSYRGVFTSTTGAGTGRTLITGIAPGVGAQFVVIGWSGNVGPDISSAQAWFNNGSPASDGWIGQSSVSGSLVLGDGASIPTPSIFNTNAPSLQGFTLGLVSPVAHASYAMAYAPPALARTSQAGGYVKLSWLTASGNFGVQSADGPFGPWNDTGLPVTDDGTNSSVSVPPTQAHKYFRLVVQ
ncbi:MAG TPA: immunoglobulin domain-containing protein [Verrucomicrobiae bacterium]|nr:immunoglobulin domain-containing protein [Verrucomicrobiae bacterium]